MAAAYGKAMTNTKACLEFIESQLQQIKYPATTASVIRPAREWLPGYTGPVSGTFTLADVGYATQQLCPITITNPAGAIPDDYRGPVTGFAGGAYAGHTVLAFLNAGGTENIVGPQAAVGPDGTFSLDLAPVPPGAPGSWNFALQDPGTFAWPVGAYWPSPPAYADLTVQGWVITDTGYLVASQPARADHTFAFPASRPGRKMFILYDTAAGANIAVHVPASGGVRSYLLAPGEPGYGTGLAGQGYSYDQAMCLIAAIAAGQAGLAGQLAGGLLQFQTAAGGFLFSGPQLSPGYGDPVYRTGAHAIATYALLAYLQAYPRDTSHDYAAAARQALGWLATQKEASGPQAGLFRGGQGGYVGPGQVDPGAPITSCATEHQFDIWHAFVKASIVLADDGWLKDAANLAEVIWTLLYDPRRQRFCQGYDPGTGLDAGDPLDMHSWGAIWARCNGRPDVAAAVLSSAALEPFVVSDGAITGYQPQYASDPSGDYPGAAPTIWSEGTFFTAYALSQAGQAAAAKSVIAGIDPAQQPDGSFAYCSIHDPVYNLSPSRCVIGPAWAVLANLGTGIWQDAAPARA